MSQRPGPQWAREPAPAPHPDEVSFDHLLAAPASGRGRRRRPVAGLLVAAAVAAAVVAAGAVVRTTDRFAADRTASSLPLGAQAGRPPQAGAAAATGDRVRTPQPGRTGPSTARVTPPTAVSPTRRTDPTATAAGTGMARPAPRAIRPGRAPTVRPAPGTDGRDGAGATPRPRPPNQNPAPIALPVYADCRAMHATHPHGVGRFGAADRTEGDVAAVTSFVEDTALFETNLALDLDEDGIACERG